MEPPFLGPAAAVVDAGALVAPVPAVAAAPVDALGAGLQADATRTAMAANTGSRFRSHNEPIAFTLPRSRIPAPLLATFGDNPAIRRDKIRVVRSACTVAVAARLQPR